MCGRYTLTASGEIIAEVFDLQTTPEIESRFNIAPTHESAVVRHFEDEGTRRLDMLRWGLVPSWAKEPGIGNRMINARAETVAEKPSFRSSFRRRRCLAVASGFYEWRKLASAKQPYYIRRTDEMPMAIAAIWDRWFDGQGEPLDTFALITTEASSQLAPIHSRMPVILEPHRFEAWLDPKQREATKLTTFLRTHDRHELTWHPVSRFVNSPSNDSPKCIEPAEEAPGLPLA